MDLETKHASPTLDLAGPAAPALAEWIVTAFYRGILRREPDPRGFADNVRGLLDARDDGALLGTLRAFLASPEFIETKGEMSFDRLKQVHAPINRAAPIQHVISLGTDCLAATVTKKLGLKRYTTPFDWIFSSPDMVRHAIEDDFAIFLDPAHYRPVPVAERQARDAERCEHLFYKAQFGVRRMFNHHDPTAAADHAYFVRAVERFRRILADPSCKLLVQCRVGSASQDDFRKTVAVLDRHACNARLLQIGIADPAPTLIMPRLEEVAVAGRHRLIRFLPTSSVAGGIAFNAEIDMLALCRLINAHNFNLM